MGETLLKMSGIVKSFPGVKALDNVNLDVEKGEVHALVGENGAGKSTLMKVLSGVHKKDAGKIEFEGECVEMIDPLQSKGLGISIIHQELNVMENMSILENIFVGTELRKSKVFVDFKAQTVRAQELLDEVGLDIDPRTKMSELSIASRQMVEIAKSLSINTKVIIMDEPTSSLTERETERLFKIIEDVCSKGIAVIYISHRLDEIFKISNRVTVLRDGKTIDTKAIEDCTKDSLVAMMVGREIDTLYPKTQGEIGKEAFRIENICTEDLLRNVSFSVRKGEVLGFSGLVGAGRTELARVIFGLDRKSSGDIYIDGEKVNIKHSSDAIKLGIGYVPEDRKNDGLILGMTVKRNITLAILKKIRNGMLLSKDKENQISKEYIQKLRIKTPSDEQVVRNLSGGNQQKVVISKWLASAPKILILDEPTRGVDVGAKKEIHTAIDNLAKTGIAIIVISSEMPEIIGVSDRIIVMHNGEKKGELSREEATQSKILHMAIN